MGGFPSGQATGDFSGRRETVALEEAGGNRRAVSACTIDEQGSVFGKLGQILGQFAEGKTQAAGDEFLFAFAWRANVDGERRWIGGQEFRGKLDTEMFGEGDPVGRGCKRLQAGL